MRSDPDYGIRNLESGVWNTECCALGYEIQLKESGISLKSQVQVPLTKNLEYSTWNAEFRTRNSERGIQKLRLSWITSYEAIGSF